MMAIGYRIRRGVDTTNGQAGYCSECSEYMPEGPDACLGYLKGVKHACCGHGDPSKAYVAFGQVTLYCSSAVDYFAWQREHPTKPFAVGWEEWDY